MTLALEARNLSISFGGVEAVRNVDLRVTRGERRVIMGPNGAGKTTLFNLLGGQLRPTAGQVLVGDQDITALPPWRRARRGLSRTFQISRVFLPLTVWENLLIAVSGISGFGPRAFRKAGADKPAARRIDELLERWSLGEHRATPVQALSYGVQRLLEIALAFAASPQVVMLDEPTAGLSTGERAMVASRLKSLPRDVTLLLTDHDMDVVFEVSDRIMVLDRGRAIADGTPAEIRANPDVLDVYLGNI
ncbi:MAG TPA: ABC transporter ATP-binding protein [Xanthobacteraceae bacterium]|nr:ABC transporter ATP-binding protein [Xanthobacteraceae bacterium]